MVSEKRLQANRANAARSTGPKTAEGKARSSRNALRHGLLAKHLLVGQENPESFHALLNMMIDRFSPVNDVEFGMIEEMTAAYWRVRRAWTIETEMLEAGVANQAPGPYNVRLAAAFGELAETSKLNVLHRQETRLHVMYQRALHNLLVLRQTPPGPDDTSILALPQFLLGSASPANASDEGEEGERNAVSVVHPESQELLAPVDPPEMRNEPNKSIPSNKIIEIEVTQNPDPNPMEPTGVDL